MAQPKKCNFKIFVREIGNGFLVCIEDQYESVVGERFCKDSASIIGQIRTWIDEIFKEKEE